MNNGENNNNNNITPPTIDPVNNNQPVNNPENPVVGQEQNTIQTPVVQPRVVDGSVQDQINNTTVVDQTPKPQEVKESKEERLKRIENEYKPISKAKAVLLVMFFVLLIAFVIFLPEITTFVNKYRAGELNQQDEKIREGRLICELTSNSTNLTYEHKWTFGFSDNKLIDLYYTTTTLGDVSKDGEVLDGLSNRCNILSAEAKKIAGVTVTCDYTDGKLIEKQNFTYSELDQELLDAAFSEAGGNSPTYIDKQDMDGIEKDMKASGATCKRERY